MPEGYLSTKVPFRGLRVKRAKGGPDSLSSFAIRFSIMYLPFSGESDIRSPSKNPPSFLRADGPLLLLFLLGSLSARVLYVMTQDVLFDDAYITYQFARNLVHGHGFSFNPGVVVYGSSSPLYTFLAAAVGFLLSTDVLPSVMRWAGTVSLMGAVSLLWFRMPVNRESKILLAILLLGYPRIFYSSLGGLEEGLIVLFMACSYAALSERSELLLGATFGLLFVTKFDSLIWIACIVFASMLAKRRVPWKALLVGAAVSIPWVVYGVSSFGSIVPHTVEAKHVAYLAEDRSLVSVLLLLPVPDGLRGSMVACLIADAIVYSSLCLAVWQCVRLKEWETLAFPLYCILYLVTLLASDMPFGLWSRWIVPMWVAVIVSLVYGLDRLILARTEARRRWTARWVWGVSIILAAATLTTPFVYPNRAGLSLWPYRETGEWLASHSHPSDSVLLEPIGAIGYLSGLYVHDFIGLVSPGITEARKAHHFSNRWFFDFISRVGPTFVVLRNEEIGRNEFMFGGYGDSVFTAEEKSLFWKEYRQVYRNRGFSEESDLVVLEKIYQ
jgi:hypothetical protein